MIHLDSRKQGAVEAVERRFAATWSAADGVAPDAWLSVEGRRIAVVVSAIDAGPVRRGAAPRLRFDKVALRLVRQLEATLSPDIPDGEAVILTVTAPIRLAGQTAAALADMVGDGMAGGAPLDLHEVVCGNQIRARRVDGVSRRAPKVIGFVHNPGPGQAEALLTVTQCLLRGLGAADDLPSGHEAERWLVIADPQGAAPLKTWGQVLDQLAIQGGPAKILLAGPGGRVEILAE